MILIDTHTHLYSEEFESDRTQMMERAFAVGVEHFFCSGNRFFLF